MEFVKDSIMDYYMKSGYASKHFRPNGKYDKNDLRQGEWKDYEVVNDFEYVSVIGKSIYTSMERSYWNTIL